jgi:RHS repeat-associated protein
VAWYLTDHLGTVRDIADPSGTVLDHIVYSSFGGIRSESNPSSGDRFKYTGREFDANGLYYYRARYYDAAIARFLSEDPIGFHAGDPNLYRYVRNDAPGAVDPLGMYEIEWKRTWTESQKTLVLTSMRLVKDRCRGLIREINAEMAKLPKNPFYGRARSGLNDLFGVAQAIIDGFYSQEENLEIKHVTFGGGLLSLFSGGASGSGGEYADKVARAYPAGPWWDARLQFNDGGKPIPWDRKKPEELAPVVLHELSHLYGTEDDNSAGPMMNAYAIEKMYNGTVAGNLNYFWLKRWCGEMAAKRREVPMPVAIR